MVFRRLWTTVKFHLKVQSKPFAWLALFLGTRVLFSKGTLLERLRVAHMCRLLENDAERSFLLLSIDFHVAKHSGDGTELVSVDSYYPQLAGDQLAMFYKKVIGRRHTMLQELQHAAFYEYLLELEGTGVRIEAMFASDDGEGDVTCAMTAREIVDAFTSLDSLTPHLNPKATKTHRALTAEEDAEYKRASDVLASFYRVMDAKFHEVCPASAEGDGFGMVCTAQYQFVLIACMLVSNRLWFLVETKRRMVFLTTPVSPRRLMRLQRWVPFGQLGLAVQIYVHLANCNSYCAWHWAIGCNVAGMGCSAARARCGKQVF